MDTFYSKYSDWYLPLDRNRKRQYERLEGLVLSFNKDLRSEVFRSKEKYNLKIRGIIAEKTGLSLTFRSSETEKRILNLKEVATIQIKVIDSVPSKLLEIFDNYDDKIIELLLHLRAMQNTVYELDFHIKNYSELVPLHGKTTDVEIIKGTILHLEKLINKVLESKILDYLNQLGPDILGAYFLSDNRVEIYWLAIAFSSLIYNLPIEDFTIIVLIHELVHGYTHIGFDKDGNKWDTDDLGRTHLNIIEGFAQLYTKWLCKDYFEKALSAFEALLPVQDSVYKEFLNWFEEDEKDKYEKARRILLKTRTKKVMNYADFLKKLDAVKADF